MLVTLATSHLLTSLSNLWAWWNTIRRVKARVRIGKNVAEGDDETAEVGGILTMTHGSYLGDIPLAHVAVELFGVEERCEERKRRALG